MRFIGVIFFLVCVCHVSFASRTVQDSLSRLLSGDMPLEQKCMIYRNLADLNYNTPDEIFYLKLLIPEAAKAGNKELLIEAVANVAMAYNFESRMDSAYYYAKQLDRIGNEQEIEGWRTYLNIYNYIAAISEGDGSAAISDVTERMKDGQLDENIYMRIQNAYIVANSFFVQEKFSQALPYAETAERLASTLPFKDGCRIHMLAIRLLSRLLVRCQQGAESIKWIEKYIELQERYYEEYYKETRPYYYIKSLRISAYTAMIVNIPGLAPEKADYYFHKVSEYAGEVTSLFDKYNCYFVLNNYYLFKRNWPKALVTNDSLMKYARSVASYNIPGLYGNRSIIYELMGEFPQALVALKKHHSLKDSLSSMKAQEHLNQLQVQYDVNKLNYENSQLEIRNKKILLVCLSAILLLSVTICIYLYRNLRKERAMKRRLCELNMKAEESERMKTLFIHSVCHEIRTPLNAIVGFSDLLSMPDIDDEMRQSFPEEIRKNSALLISLISRMLEVAELDVSNEKLPVELADVHVICVQAMEKFRNKGGQSVLYELDIPEEPFPVHTNSHYLMLVLENLLDNACKFTESGQITLHYEIDPAANKLLIRVADTGCGIPAEMYEKVFERFSKLDAYKPGNGLGLYLCRLVVIRLSGSIYIDPDYTGGTRVCVELPID